MHSHLDHLREPNISLIRREAFGPPFLHPGLLKTLENWLEHVDSVLDCRQSGSCRAGSPFVWAATQTNRWLALGRFSKGSGYGRNLSDDLSFVVILQLLLRLIVGRERMNHQRTVLETAASAYIGSVPSQKHVYRLLPQRF